MMGDLVIEIVGAAMDLGLASAETDSGATIIPTL